MIKVFEKLPYVLRRDAMEDMISLSWDFDEFKSSEDKMS